MARNIYLASSSVNQYHDDVHVTLKDMGHDVYDACDDLNIDAINWCDSYIILLPCDPDAHFGAGYAMGADKEIFVVGEDTGHLYYNRHVQHILKSPSDLMIALSFDPVKRDPLS